MSERERVPTVEELLRWARVEGDRGAQGSPFESDMKWVLATRLHAALARVAELSCQPMCACNCGRCLPAEDADHLRSTLSGIESQSRDQDVLNRNLIAELSRLRAGLREIAEWEFRAVYVFHKCPHQERARRLLGEGE